MSEQNQNQETQPNQSTEPQYVTKDMLTEVLAPLLKEVKDEANKGVNAVDRKSKEEINALKSLIQSLNVAKAEAPDTTTVITTETDAQQPHGKLTTAAVKKEAEDKISAKDREWQEKFDKLVADLQKEKEAGLQKERKAFESSLSKECYRKFTDNGFEDVSDAIDVFFAVYKPQNFLDEDGTILYKANEDAEAETYDSLIEKFKGSNKGKRFLPATDSPKGAGLPKNSSTATTQKAEKKASDKLQETMAALRSGKLEIGYKDR